MPVHRPALKDRSAVVAFSDELEHWLSRASPAVRNNCVPIRDQEEGESNESLLRALDNMSTLVQQSMQLISRLRILEERRARLRKFRHRRIGLRRRAHPASVLGKGTGSVLFLAPQSRILPAKSLASAGYAPATYRATSDKAREHR